MKQKFIQRRQFLVLAGIVLFVCFVSLVELDPERPVLTYTAGVAILMAFWWVTEAIPIGVTSLLPVFLFPLFGVMDSGEAAGAYVNYVIFLYIGGFIMALAMEKWDLHRRIALFILLKVGQRPIHILFGFMFAGYFLSMWMSNTATAMLMVPISLSIMKNLEDFYPNKIIRRFSIAVFLGLAYACSIGGTATLIGTPPNLSFARIYAISFPEAPEISFSSWFIFALPLSLIILGVALIVLYLMYVPKKNMDRISKTLLQEKYTALGSMSREEKWVGGLFTLMALLWVFRTPIVIGGFSVPGWSQLFDNPGYFNDGSVAIAMAVLLFLIPSRENSGLMDWKTAVKLPWDIVLLFGGGFALALAVKETGLGLWLGQQVMENSNWSPVELMAVLTAGMSFLTEFTSNTATTEMVLPIVAGISETSGIPPLLLMIPITLAASLAFMLPIATPPNAIIFGSSPLRIIDMAKAGIVIDVIAVILVIIGMYLWGIPVFGISV
ncbi:SLC13 family permease [Membranicola marinus]|uniref:SLC13 family permease n=1 Tax=Membranihabitans marinus TaxID=1227546 RepID=A0A953L9X8_9BACT|nr:SLC13 family permease [Membranihabitans marinus]MBY5958108.1 SLC13 family permease [Membranihabitans marinus]